MSITGRRGENTFSIHESVSLECYYVSGVLNDQLRSEKRKKERKNQLYRQDSNLHPTIVKTDWEQRT